jgi:hypothetical protein
MYEISSFIASDGEKRLITGYSVLEIRINDAAPTFYVTRKDVLVYFFIPSPNYFVSAINKEIVILNKTCNI